jgi:transposase
MELKRISIDTSKHIFTIHGVDRQEHPVLRREIRRSQFESFFAKLEPTEVALEACAGSHHWGRLLSRLGHRVKLIPPQYVKPFVKRSKNDRNDAEAIGEAASRPAMRTVPLKTTVEQAATIIVKHREMLVAQRTQAINALRGHAAEFGIIAAKGCPNVTALLSVLASDEAIPVAARAMFEAIGQHVADLDTKIEELDRRLLDQHKVNPVSRLLAAMPGVGPITAITMALTVNPRVTLSRGGISRPGWGSRQGNTRPPASIGLVKLARPAMRGYDSCWWLGRCP